MDRVLVTLKMPVEHLAPLDGVVEIEMSPHRYNVMPRDEVLEKIPGCVGLISQGELKIDGDLLETAGPQLTVVANVSMGIDNLDLDALTSRGIWGTNTPDAFVESTADTTLGLILATVRRLGEGDRFVRAGEWESAGMQPARWEGRLLGEMTLGMVGYGQIARAVEKRALAFGMKVIHSRANPSGDPNCRSLPDLLAEADAVALHVPHTPSTHQLFNRETFARMKPGAFFFNLARGKVADESALVEALQSGHLAGAGLDVFEAEPKVQPALQEMENVVMVPHLGGSTVEDRRRGRMQAAENVARVLRGERPVTPVNRVEA